MTRKRGCDVKVLYENTVLSKTSLDHYDYIEKKKKETPKTKSNQFNKRCLLVHIAEKPRGRSIRVRPGLVTQMMSTGTQLLSALPLSSDARRATTRKRQTPCFNRKSCCYLKASNHTGENREYLLWSLSKKKSLFLPGPQNVSPHISLAPGRRQWGQLMGLSSAGPTYRTGDKALPGG